MPRRVSLLQLALRGPRKFVSEGPYIRDSTQRFGKRFPCFYCSHILRSEGGRVRHILLMRNCRLTDDKQAEALSPSDVKGDPRQIVVPDTVLDKRTKPEHTSPAKPQDNGPTDARPASPPACTAQPSPPPPLSLSPPSSASTRLEYDANRQVFVEHYPDPRAGAPMSDEIVQPIDLRAYMAKAGNLGNPNYFETLDLLMTTGLNNAGWDAYLKSRLYEGQTPWVNNENMMADLDK
ncbi:hypothetical protein FRC08_010129 [Ceratobasidium sp. 394]|nr:hypothetical protein FRC08_010129 [Ceratobasidium sp. 394]KAG9101462.1 hypothetical protein FS749_006681 [Ceratobasidium sp. UAMH 11750]